MMRKKIMITGILIAVIGIISYNYIYKSHRDIENEKAAFSLSAIDLHAAFNTNPIEAKEDYLNTTVEIIGILSEIGNNSITLEDKVFCQFIKTIETNLVLNTQIKIKGRVIGYDDLLEQVKIDQCSIK